MSTKDGYVTRINCICYKNVLKGIPLSGAAKNGHTDIVRLLIENGADVNEKGRVR